MKVSRNESAPMNLIENNNLRWKEVTRKTGETDEFLKCRWNRKCRNESEDVG